MNEGQIIAASATSAGRESDHQKLSLVELWSVLVRRKFLVLLIFTGIMSGTVLTLFLLPSRYESFAVIAIGQLDATYSGQKSLEQPEVMVERLRHLFRVGDLDLDRSLPHISKVSFSAAGSKQVISLRAVASSPMAANDFLKRSIAPILEEHTRRYEDTMAVLHKRLAALNLQLDNVRQDIKELDERARQLKTKDPVAAALVVLERAKLLELEPTLASDRTALELALLPSSSQPSRLLREPTMPITASSPRQALYLTLGLIFGVVLALFIAGFVDYFAGKSRETAESNTQPNGV